MTVFCEVLSAKNHAAALICCLLVSSTYRQRHAFTSSSFTNNQSSVVGVFLFCISLIFYKLCLTDTDCCVD